jgi:hypothetical protein
MAKRRNYVDKAAWGRHTNEFPHRRLCVLNVFKYRIALNAAKKAVRERQALDIGGYVYPWHRK